MGFDKAAADHHLLALALFLFCRLLEPKRKYRAERRALVGQAQSLQPPAQVSKDFEIVQLIYWARERHSACVSAEIIMGMICG